MGYRGYLKGAVAALNDETQRRCQIDKRVRPAVWQRIVKLDRYVQRALHGGGK